MGPLGDVQLVAREQEASAPDRDARQRLESRGEQRGAPGGPVVAPDVGSVHDVDVARRIAGQIAVVGLDGEPERGRPVEQRDRARRALAVDRTQRAAPVSISHQHVPRERVGGELERHVANQQVGPARAVGADPVRASGAARGRSAGQDVAARRVHDHVRGIQHHPGVVVDLDRRRLVTGQLVDVSGRVEHGDVPVRVLDDGPQRVRERSRSGVCELGVHARAGVDSSDPTLRGAVQESAERVPGEVGDRPVDRREDLAGLERRRSGWNARVRRALSRGGHCQQPGAGDEGPHQADQGERERHDEPYQDTALRRRQERRIPYPARASPGPRFHATREPSPSARPCRSPACAHGNRRPGPVGDSASPCHCTDLDEGVAPSILTS